MRAGELEFFQVIWANLRGYNHWLGMQKELAAQRARLAALEGAAPAPQQGGLPPAAAGALAAAGASVAGGVACWPGCPAVDLRALAPGGGCPELEALLAAVVQQVGALEREVEAARAGMEREQRSGGELRARLEAAQQAQRAAEQQHAELQRQLERAQSEAAQLPHLRTDLATARAEAGRATQQARRAEAAAASNLEAARAEAVAALDASRRRQEEQRKELEKVALKNQRLQQRLSDLNKRVNGRGVKVVGAAQGGGAGGGAGGGGRAIVID
jgi:hypothetical protein